MEDKETPEKESSPKKETSKKGNILLFLVISGWLLFYIYMGSVGGFG